jgi:hypothetical protein
MGSPNEEANRMNEIACAWLNQVQPVVHCGFILGEAAFTGWGCLYGFGGKAGIHQPLLCNLD